MPATVHESEYPCMTYGTGHLRACCYRRRINDKVVRCGKRQNWAACPDEFFIPLVPQQWSGLFLMLIKKKEKMFKVGKIKKYLQK